MSQNLPVSITPVDNGVRRFNNLPPEIRDNLKIVPTTIGNVNQRINQRDVVTFTAPTAGNNCFTNGLYDKRKEGCYDDRYGLAYLNVNGEGVVAVRYPNKEGQKWQSFKLQDFNTKRYLTYAEVMALHRSGKVIQWLQRLIQSTQVDSKPLVPNQIVGNQSPIVSLNGQISEKTNNNTLPLESQTSEPYLE